MEWRAPVRHEDGLPDLDRLVSRLVWISGLTLMAAALASEFLF